MRVRSYPEMLTEYGILQLDPSDEADRADLLCRLPYSVIVEGGHIELENLEKWIRMTLGEQAITCLHYGKTGYDFGFAEYFFNNEVSMRQTAEVVSKIYTKYPDSLKPDQVCRSIGYDHEERADSQDLSAIVFIERVAPGSIVVYRSFWKTIKFQPL